MVQVKDSKHIHTLLIVSHVLHYQHNGRLYAYGPYVREIDIWADLFPEITIASPCRTETPPKDCLPFTRSNICIQPQLETGGETWKSKAMQFLSLPILIISLIRALLNADAVLVRCPGNLGLLGAVLAPLFLHYRVAKYSNQWNGYPGEAWSYRLQRTILGSWWWNAPVTVYGTWPGQSRHVIPFFTSILEKQQLEAAKNSATNKKLHAPLRILFVGRLSYEKNVHILLDAIHLLQENGIEFECRIIGEGLMKNQLGQQVKSLGLNTKDVLIGGLPFEKVFEHYEWADVLVLASETEGWPKAIAEGMALGLVCIGSNRGLVPQMLADGRGITVEPGDSIALASVLQDIANGRVDFTSVSHKAAEWGGRYSLEGLRDALRELLIKEWHLSKYELG